MHDKFYNSKEFKDLELIWYKKLKNQHFSDVERAIKNGNLGTSAPFSVVLPPKFHYISHQDFQNILKHYENARAFLISHKFASRRHKILWEYYADGVSYRNMIKDMKRRNLVNIPSIFKISKMINEIKKEFIIWVIAQPAEASEDLDSIENLMQSNTSILDE